MFTFLLVLAMSGQTAPMELVCSGKGAARRSDTSTAWVSDNNGNSGDAVITGRRSENFADQVDVVIDGDNSRIRLPRTMLPSIHGGDDGWFELKDVEIGSTAIEGSAGVNFMNHPKVHIDRRTGTINISGRGGHYTGQCEKVDPDASNKF